MISVHYSLDRVWNKIGWLKLSSVKWEKWLFAATKVTDSEKCKLRCVTQVAILAMLQTAVLWPGIFNNENRVYYCYCIHSWLDFSQSALEQGLGFSWFFVTMSEMTTRQRFTRLMMWGHWFRPSLSWSLASQHASFSIRPLSSHFKCPCWNARSSQSVTQWNQASWQKCCRVCSWL